MRRGNGWRFSAGAIDGQVRIQYLLVSNGERLLVGPNEAGDEPFLMAQRCPKAIVAVGADRYELGDWVLNRFPIDCLVLDDGFQHLGLYRDVNLLLVDATDAEGLAALVPAGRLREPLQAAARATAIVVTRADVPDQVTQVCHRLQATTRFDAGPDPGGLSSRESRVGGDRSVAAAFLVQGKNSAAL